MAYKIERFYDFGVDEDLAILAALESGPSESGGGGETVVNMFLDYSTSTNVANSVVETSLLGAGNLGTSKTITPGLAAVGRTFELYFYGVMGWTAAPGLTVRLRMGGLAGTLLQIYTLPLVGASGGNVWRFSSFVTITAVGAGGSIQANPGMIEFNLGGGADGAVQWSGRNQNIAAVDLSSSKDFTLTVQWAVADPLNFFTYNFGCINIVR